MSYILQHFTDIIDYIENQSALRIVSHENLKSQSIYLERKSDISHRLIGYETTYIRPSFIEVDDVYNDNAFDLTPNAVC